MYTNTELELGLLIEDGNAHPVYFENLSAPTTSMDSLSAKAGKKSIPAINSGLTIKRISSYMKL